MRGIFITCWNWLKVRSPESPFSKTTNVFNADSSTDGSTLVWRTFSDFLVLEFFSAPGSKPSSSFVVSYPLQFPLILGRSNLFLNLWQVQFVNNFSKAAKVIGTKTSQADQQFQGFSDPLKCPVDIAGVLFLTLSFWQLFCTCKYIIVKRITKHQTAVTKPEPRIKRNDTGQFPQSNCVLLFTFLLISLW